MLPLLAATYGPPGIGKTVDLGYSFPNGDFIGQPAEKGGPPAGLMSITQVCGYTPRGHVAKTMADATAIIKKLPKGGNTVLDDFSGMARETVRSCKKRFRNGYDVWDTVLNDAIDLITALSERGGVGVLNCWNVDPKSRDDGSRRRGGPELVGKLVEQVPARCDMVLRVDVEPMRKPWPAVYKCGLDRNYVMKDRLNIVSRVSPAPMNLREILRSGGISLPYIHEGQAEMTDQVVAYLAQQDNPTSSANELYQQLVAAGSDHPYARWVMRDALDRVVIDRALAQHNSNFIL
ncbi:ATP-binding protein [bacterium]|nr:ATP-binding protein [bacterium]